MITQEAITAALKKLGPSSPGQLADHLNVEQSALAYHVRKLIAEGALKAAGKTTGRRLALAEQDLDTAAESAPPSAARRRSTASANTMRARRKGTPSRARAAAPEPAERFIPAIDAESRLVIVNGAEPHIFSEEQTAAIATLLFQHYNEE